MKRHAIAASLGLCASFSLSAQQGDGTDVAIQTHTFKPAKVEVTPARIDALEVPAGFAVAPFATDLKNVRILAVAPDGTAYASRRDQGDVIMLRDADNDGRADAPAKIVAHRAGAHGLAIHDGKLYLATVKEIFSAPIRQDGSIGDLTMLLGDLPDAGQHPNRTIAFGPDGMLYISAGSTCNACNESNPENATLLRASADGKSRIIFASGLRNTIGFGWQPETGELWGMDHGIDYLGDEIQKEELNKIEQGKQYGWPHVFADGGINPQSTPPGAIGKEQWKATSVPMTLGYTAHAAPMQMTFYSGGNFPAEYQGDAFVAMRGSWNRKPASGYEVVRIDYENGQPTRIEPFLTGFLVDRGTRHIARPVGIAQMPDGALLISDDANGTIYRITSRSGTSAGKQDAPVEPMKRQAMQGTGVPLSLARAETEATGKVAIRSATIHPDGPIPLKHSEYADGVSPQLSWTPVDGAKSYALIMEDPDAKPITPFVHWVAWNIPGDTTTLPEGLQEQPRLTEPEGLMQGATSRGSIGYFGPRPPVGDPDHHYHFQLLALDTMLDLPMGSTRDQLLAAVKGHVVAKGELIARYRQQIKPPK